MSKLRVEIDIDDSGACTASLHFRKQELEAEGSSPSEALQSLAEELALLENDETEKIPADLAASRARLRGFGADEFEYS